MNRVEDLLLQELQELLGAEQQIVKALPKLVTAANDRKLRSAFKKHLKQTKVHVDRLQEVFHLLNASAESLSSEPIAGMIAQADALISSGEPDPALLDSALIAAAQKVEHYEIALYGAARAHARLLGYSKVADLLGKTLLEEEQTDALLTRLAVKKVNLRAMKAPLKPAGPVSDVPSPDGFGLGALFSGLALGVAVGILYAPKPGEEIRRAIKAKAGQLKSQQGDSGNRTMEDEGYIHQAQ